MLIDFYRCTDDPRKLNKNFGIATYSAPDAKPFESMSVTNPVLIMGYNAAIANATYFYLPEFARYYRVTSCVLQNGGRCVVTGEVDVLSSFKSSIGNLKVNVENNQWKQEQYIPDTQVGFTNASMVHVLESDLPLLIGASKRGGYETSIVMGVLGSYKSTLV